MKLTTVDIVKEVLAFIGYAAGVVYVVASFSTLPEVIPIHFGLLGKPDGWAPKGAIVIVPIAATFLYATLTLGQYFGKPNVPWRITPENREKIYGLTKNLLWWMKAQISWMIAYIEFAQVEVAHHRMEGLGGFFAPTFLGMIFFSLAIYFYIGHRAAQAH